MPELLSLFLSFLQVGLFSVGGGYAGIPLIQHQVVELHPWMTLNEFTDLLTIAEMTPGPIAVNSATFVGIRIAGVPGAVIATIGCILPSLIIVTLLGYIYKKYHSMKGMQIALSTLRPAIVALIASAFITLLLNAVVPAGLWDEAGRFAAENVDILSLILFGAGLFTIRRLKQNPILVMIGCGVIYMLIHLVI